jgi:hypothetical protein
MSIAEPNRNRTHGQQNKDVIDQKSHTDFLILLRRHTMAASCEYGDAVSQIDA